MIFKCVVSSHLFYVVVLFLVVCRILSVLFLLVYVSLSAVTANCLWCIWSITREQPTVTVQRWCCTTCPGTHTHTPSQHSYSSHTAGCWFVRPHTHTAGTMSRSVYSLDLWNEKILQYVTAFVVYYNWTSSRYSLTSRSTSASGHRFSPDQRANELRAA